MSKLVASKPVSTVSKLPIDEYLDFVREANCLREEGEYIYTNRIPKKLNDPNSLFLGTRNNFQELWMLENIRSDNPVLIVTKNNNYERDVAKHADKEPRNDNFPPLHMRKTNSIPSVVPSPVDTSPNCKPGQGNVPNKNITWNKPIVTIKKNNEIKADNIDMEVIAECINHSKSIIPFLEKKKELAKRRKEIEDQLTALNIELSGVNSEIDTVCNQSVTKIKKILGERSLSPLLKTNLDSFGLNL